MEKQNKTSSLRERSGGLKDPKQSMPHLSKWINRSFGDDSDIVASDCSDTRIPRNDDAYFGGNVPISGRNAIVHHSSFNIQHSIFNIHLF